MNRGSVSIDNEKGISVTPASKGAGQQIDLIVLLGIMERMNSARAHKMVYGIVTAVEANTIKNVVQAFALEAQRSVNEEAEAALKEEAERLEGIRQRRLAMEARQANDKRTVLRRRADGSTTGKR